MGQDDGSPRSGLLRSRLVQARDRAFVGRDTELASFRSAMAHSGPPVLYLHGPGGIGKSTLLRRYAREARDAGRYVVEVDGRTVTPTPEGLAEAAGAALRRPDAVLLIDTFEVCQGLEGWLWEQFLPELPLGAVAVVAGRVAPGARWVLDAGWRDHLRVTALRNLPPGDAAAYLRASGVSARAHAALLSFTGGNPLALALAAAVAARGGGGERQWTADQDVIATLLPQLVGDVPTPLHRTALEVCAHAYVTTETLLRAMVGEQASELFAWLRGQPFVESTAAGIHPHDVVREALEADLRWRDPEGFRAMHHRMHHYLFEQVRAASPGQVLGAVGALLYMYRSDGHMPEFHEWHALGLVQDTPCAPRDQRRLEELTEEAEGPESAAIARYWLDRQPEAFRVYRSTRTGQTVAFTAVLWLDEEQGPVGTDVDPVMAAAWAHSRATAPLRAGERKAVARFTVHPPLYQRPSAPTTLAQWRLMGEIYRAKRLGWHYVVMRDDGFWDAHLTHFDMLPLDARPRVGEHPYVLFAHDWRQEPVVSWLAAKTDAMLNVGQPDSAGNDVTRRELVVLSRPEFDAAVREALRHLYREDVLARNPLQRSRVVVEHGHTLGDVLLASVGALLGERDGEKRHRALTAAYLMGTATQEAAAHRAGMPFSTYRRHLRAGLERVSDLLWHHELTGTPLASLPGRAPDTAGAPTT